MDQSRKRVVSSGLLPPCGLAKALERFGFVQAVPVRSPARAQHLILRHRVTNYWAGDLERSYPELGLEECYLYGYGFLSKDLWQILHPKTDEPIEAL